MTRDLYNSLQVQKTFALFYTFRNIHSISPFIYLLKDFSFWIYLAQIFKMTQKYFEVFLN